MTEEEQEEEDENKRIRPRERALGQKHGNWYLLFSLVGVMLQLGPFS